MIVIGVYNLIDGLKKWEPNLSSQLMLTKFFKRELFSCLPKVDHVIKSCKEPIYLQFWPSM